MSAIQGSRALEEGNSNGVFKRNVASRLDLGLILSRASWLQPRLFQVAAEPSDAS